MNEINIKKFVELTEEYLRHNSDQLSELELESVNELYDDLSHELARQQVFDELYH
jgi:hypothetical protein